jgi:microcystin-dependent protein
MDKYIAQGAGFPADNEFLMLIQSMIVDAAKLSSIGGPDYILNGCEVVGGNVAAGFMVLDGEVVRFAGGPIATQVTVIETVENATYLEDLSPVDGQGDSKATYFTRTAQFGTNGIYTINWANLERLKPLIEAQRALTPLDGVIMYAGNINAIPAGWRLCDGTNGTANLTGQFIVGYDAGVVDYDSIGKSGGLDNVILSTAQMPSHAHTGTTNSAGAHTHTTTGYSKNQQSVDNGGGSVVADSVGNSPNTGSAGAHSHTMNLNNTGNNAPHENRPPYYVLAYIQFKGV